MLMMGGLRGISGLGVLEAAAAASVGGSNCAEYGSAWMEPVRWAEMRESKASLSVARTASSSEPPRLPPPPPPLPVEGPAVVRLLRGAPSESPLIALIGADLEDREREEETQVRVRNGVAIAPDLARENIALHSTLMKI